MAETKDLTEEGKPMLKTMKNKGDEQRKPLVKHPVKLTALLYLKEAIKREQYELCEELIAVAKEFGAASYEVQDLLEDPRRVPG